MGELDSTTRQKGARSLVLPVRPYSSQACSVTILRKRDVETGHVASQWFFAASLRLKAWIDMVEPGVIVVNLVRIILSGGFAPTTQGNPRPYGMPPFGHTLSDPDVAAVATYVRNAWGNKAGAVMPLNVQKTR